MDNPAEHTSAFISLYRGLDRQGPGDAAFSRSILRTLSLSPQPRIADLGCGCGAGTLLLAEQYQCQVIAVDSSSDFIQELTVRANQAGLTDLVVPVHGDMAKLDWPDASVDLLWSEGAAYNLGFEQALKLWHRLLADDGIAVVSELSWFTHEIPESAYLYWHKIYPMMATEAENIDRANRAGFTILSTDRLPSHAWWKNYYEPVSKQMQQLEITPVTQAIISEMTEEIAMFEKFSDSYGYTFYILQAA